MGERLLVATKDGLHDLGGDRPVRLADGRWTALAADGGEPWGLVDRRTVRHGTDEVAAVGGGLDGTCLLPLGDDVLVGTSGAHLLRLRAGRLERVDGFEAAEGRERWYTPWGAPPASRSLAQAADGALYVNVHVGGIVASTDGGATWAPTGIDVDADVHQVLCHGDTVLAAAAVGLARSDDGGRSYRIDTDGLDATYSRAVAVAGDTLLLSASNGPGGGGAAVYRRPLDGDGPFERCRGGLPEQFGDNVDTHCLVADDHRAALGTADGRVFVSADAGATWDLVADGLPPVLSVLL